MSVADAVNSPAGIDATAPGAGATPAPAQPFNFGWIAFALSLAAAGAWIGWRWYSCPPPLERLRIYVEEQAWELATPGLERYLKYYPQDAEARSLFARSLAAEERFVDSAAVLAASVGGASERAEALFRAGQSVLFANRRRAAERYWNAALEVESTDPGAVVWQQEARRELCNLFAVERRRTDLSRMTSDLLRFAVPAERHQPLTFRARSLTTVVEPASVIPVLESAVAADPSDYESLCALGLYRIDAEKIAEGKNALAQCRQARPNDPFVWESWCWALDKLGEVNELAKAVKEAPEAVRNTASAARFRSLTAEQADNNLTRAIAETEKALGLDPEPALEQRLGQLLTRAGKREDGKRRLDLAQKQMTAIVQLRDLLDQFRANYTPGDVRGAPIAERIAALFDTLGRVEEARHWRRFALVVDPNYKPSAAALEKSYSTTSR